MKLPFCILIFLCSISWSFGQTYYVALVKGKVYYKNKLLRKRDKIKMKGQLKFSSSGDYVKLSGPGGLYTITPESQSNSINEFWIAVKEELFRRQRRHTTAAMDMVMDGTCYFNLRGISYTFFDKTQIGYQVPKLKAGEELGFLHETDRGLFYRTATIKDSLLVIRKKDFKLPKKNDRRPVIETTSIVKVMKKEPWLELVQGKDSIAQLGSAIFHYNLFRPELAPIIEIDPYTGIKTVTDPYPDELAEILDSMGPPRFIKKRKMIKDLKFHVRKSNAPDIETFMEEYEYESYIRDTYGNLYDPILNHVLRNDLGLSSQYDDVEF